MLDYIFLYYGEILFLSLTKTKMLENKNDNPGIYIPPPLLYVATFFVAILIQRVLPLNKEFFYTTPSKLIGSAIVLISFLVFNFPALRQFFRTKNTLVTIKPANSLQTTGIYSLSRNPMYIGLLLFFIGLSFMIGNWWNFIILPFLILIVQEYLIKREERYLERKFGSEYSNYKTKVRRWL